MRYILSRLTTCSKSDTSQPTGGSNSHFSGYNNLFFIDQLSLSEYLIYHIHRESEIIYSGRWPYLHQTVWQRRRKNTRFAVSAKITNVSIIKCIVCSQIIDTFLLTQSTLHMVAYNGRDKTINISAYFPSLISQIIRCDFTLSCINN